MINNNIYIYIDIGAISTTSHDIHTTSNKYQTKPTNIMNITSKNNKTILLFPPITSMCANKMQEYFWYGSGYDENVCVTVTNYGML